MTMNNKDTEAPERLFVQLTPMGGTISYKRDPREVHDNGKPVYVYRLVDTEGGDSEPTPLARLLISQQRGELTKNIWALVTDSTPEQLAHWYVSLNMFEWPKDCPLNCSDEDRRWAAEMFVAAIEKKVDADYLTLHWQSAGNTTERKAALARAALDLSVPPKTHIRKDWKA